MQDTTHTAALPAGAPDSELCRRATALVAQVSQPFLFNHCVRTFLFAEALGNRDGLKPDREILYLSSMLHDLGLTDTYANRSQRFEVEGADRARAFVVDHGLPDDKAEVVWDAIALNTSFGIALRKGTEVALTHLGASADFLGTRLEELRPATVARIVDEYPRSDFIPSATKLFVACARRAPQWVPGTFLEMVAHSHATDLPVPTYADLLAQSSWKE